MTRDMQKAKVYRWEQAAIFGEPMLEQEYSLDECVRLVEKAWRYYYQTATPPIVTDGRGRSRTACGNMWRLRLPRFARRRPIILHEVAHAIIHAKMARVDHGPEFARVYVDLLARFDRVVPMTDILKAAREYHVKVAAIANAPRPRP